ncbi:hypothetical protein LTR09_010284 [Extremus antarcticus]|uniref:Myb-like domain-containing protein n=1 Tax=Extremus antarcticus TaxID=702011 RepID=A0AAJ0DDZ9_9PEZI|nr:hypothetical protein LTR09_010284 [Extremus antarcticus]
MEWQKAQYQTFQIMWSMKPNNEYPPPLQIRSFTSDSYRAIKTRERKRCRQKKAHSKQWKAIPQSDTRSESASLDTVVDALWSGTELEDDSSMSDSRRLQPVALEDCRAQLNGEPQQNLHRPSAQPIGPVEIHREGTIRCLDVSTSSATSPIAPGSTFPELIADTEPGCDATQAADTEQSIASAHDADLIVSDDVDTSVEEPGSGLLHETDMASPTPSYPTPTHSCVAGCNAEPCEQSMQDCDGAPPRLVSHQPNTVHLLVAATSQTSNDFALAKVLPDAQGHTCRIGDHGSRTCQAGFDQVGCISGKRNPVPQNLWTKDLDEHLLHLRNVAQLKWGDLANYFPAITPGDIKRRHEQLSKTKRTTQDMGTRHSARFEKRSTAAFPTASTFGKCQSKITKHYHALYGAAARPGRPNISKSQYLLHYQPLKARYSGPHAADDRSDTRSDIGLKKAICKSVERSGISFGTEDEEAAEFIFHRTAAQERSS